MKLELIKKNKKKLLVDFNKFKSVMSFKNDLKTKWGFNPDQINKTLNKYSGQLFMYSPEHAAIMFELLERHLKPMSKHERSGYIASKKMNYIRLGDSNARPHREFCVSDFRQNQEYHVFNVHAGAYSPCLHLSRKVGTVCAPYAA